MDCLWGSGDGTTAAVRLPDHPGHPGQTRQGRRSPWPTTTPGASTLAYDPVSGTHSYVWKTDEAWTGTCRVFNVTLDDRSIHSPGSSSPSDEGKTRERIDHSGNGSMGRSGRRERRPAVLGPEPEAVPGVGHQCL